MKCLAIKTDEINYMEFLTTCNNGCISNDFMRTETDGNLVSNEQELMELFNKHYISIVEKLENPLVFVIKKFHRCISK